MIESKLILFEIEFDSILIEQVYKIDTIGKENSNKRYLEMTKMGILPFSHMSIFLPKFTLLKKIKEYFIGDNNCLQRDMSFENDKVRELELKRIPEFSNTIKLDFSKAFYESEFSIRLNKYMYLWETKNGFCICIKEPTSQYYNKIYEEVIEKGKVFDDRILELSQGSININKIKAEKRIIF